MRAYLCGFGSVYRLKRLEGKLSFWRAAPRPHACLWEKKFSWRASCPILRLSANVGLSTNDWSAAMPRFNLDDYETVATRLEKFWADNPQGRVHSEMVSSSDTGFIIRAEVYSDREDARPVATGLAEEHWADKGVNATSPVENCETSAIGRALANWIYVTKSDKRPSREEMEKVQRRQEKAEEARTPDADIAQQIRVFIEEGVHAVTEQDQLKAKWVVWTDFLDFLPEECDMTLRQAILTRKAELEVDES
jgi:hypothetical protein